MNKAIIHHGDGHVGQREMASLIAIGTAGSLFLGYPQTLLAHGASAAWLIPIFSVFPTLLGWWALTALLRLYPDKGLNEIYETVLGPWLGTLVNVVWIVLWWLLLGVTLREFADTVAISVLPTTPVSVIALMFFLAAAYAAFRGVEPLARAAYVLLPWLLLPTVVILALTYVWWNVYNLTPIWGTGFVPLTVWSVLKAGNYGELALLAVLAPAMRQPAQVARTGYYALFGAAAITTSVVLVYLLTWTVPSAIRAPFPFIKLARLAFIGRFVQRIEALYVIVWVVVGVIVGGLAVNAISKSIAQTLRLRQFRPLLLPQAFIIFALMFVPKQLLTARELDAVVLRHLLPLLTIALPIVVYPLAHWRRRQAHAAT